MPVIYRHKFDCSELILWNITESEEELMSLVTVQDGASVEGLIAAPRRLERLSWRAALRSIGIVEEVDYNDLGAPYLVGSPKHISVSHCRGAACVLISEMRCAVDMESSSRDCSKSATRFLSPSEREFVEDYANPECVAWCVKEALYKFSGRNGLDFLIDIHIEGTADSGLIAASVGGSRSRVQLLEIEEYLIAAIV